MKKTINLKTISILALLLGFVSYANAVDIPTVDDLNKQVPQLPSEKKPDASESLGKTDEKVLEKDEEKILKVLVKDFKINGNKKYDDKILKDLVKESINQDRICAGTIDSWIIWHLTKGKVFATDITNAARTNLFNIGELKWDDDLLNLFEVNKSILPEVLESDAFYGQSEALIKKLPIYGVIGDQQSAAIGQKCFNFGDIKSTYGTGCFVLLIINSS